MKTTIDPNTTFRGVAPRPQRDIPQPEAKHSPSPWEWDYDTANDRFILRSKTSGSFGHFQGWSADGVTTEEQDEANADFILRAVNSHDALLAALKDCLEQIDHLWDHLGSDKQRFCRPTTIRCQDKASAAIRQCEEGKL